MKRRDLLKAALALPALRIPRRPASTPSRRACDSGSASRVPDQPPAATDFIVVGSGAEEEPSRPALLKPVIRCSFSEAGDDPQTVECDVPAFHPFATENEAMRWDLLRSSLFGSREGAARSSSCADKGVCGIRVPAHSAGVHRYNAMISSTRPNQDWDQLADLTGDASWRAENMRPVFRAPRGLPSSPAPIACAASSA